MCAQHNACPIIIIIPHLKIDLLSFVCVCVCVFVAADCFALSFLIRAVLCLTV